QAEDGIRDFHVTGVQTCALPIYVGGVGGGDVGFGHREGRADPAVQQRLQPPLPLLGGAEHVQHLHVPGVRGGAVERLRGEAGAEIGRASCRERGGGGVGGAAL